MSVKFLVMLFAMAAPLRKVSEVGLIGGGSDLIVNLLLRDVFPYQLHT